MKRLTLTITTLILLITPASAGAFPLDYGSKHWESTEADLVDTRNPLKTIYYFNTPVKWGYQVTYDTALEIVKKYDTTPPIEFEPSHIDTRAKPVELEPKPGCKQQTNYGRLKIRLKNIDCQDATDILEPEHCTRGKSKWEFRCREGKAAIKTEYAYKETPVKAWRYCGNQIYIKQYALFSTTGSCDLTGVIDGIKAHIIQSMMPDGYAANRYGFREGNRLAVMETNAIWDYAVPADGKDSNHAAWWSFPSLPVLEIY